MIEAYFMPLVKYICFFAKFSYNEIMFRIWAKVFSEDHIIKQHVYEKEEPFAYSSFFTYLTEICDALDVPTPVLLKTHIMNYAKFNTVTFRPADYMEEVPFQKMVLENIL